MTGAVDGGAGIDTVGFSVGSDVTLNATAMPTNFERLQLTVTDDATVTLGTGLDLSNGITVGGSGTLANASNFTSSGPAISTLYSYPSSLSIENSGNVISNLTDSTAFAFQLGTLVSGSNSGSITANGGGGVSAYMNSGADGYSNSGTITASGVGAAIIGQLDNGGTIVSTGGIGVSNTLGGGTIRGITSTNSGTITGVAAGVYVDSINFANTGTISASGGPGVALGYYAGFDNQAGGVVNGANGTAIGYTGYGYNAVVQNAGTINGDVNLAAPGGYDSSPDVFVDNGGTVNGNLMLGGGDDTLVTTLDTGRALAGVTGKVDGGDGFDTIVYKVSSDTSTDLSVPTSFEGLGFDLSGGAALTLSASTVQAVGLRLSGQGSVDITADLLQADTTVIDMTALNVAQLTGTGTSTPSDLSVVSHGTLTYVGTNPYSYYGAYAVNAGIGSFENAGTISVTGAPGSYYAPAAIFGSGTVTNSGTILLDGATAASGGAAFINSGSILQMAGGASSSGVTAASLVNSGTISVGATAFYGFNNNYFSPASVTNTGTIESTGGTAIYSATMVTNAAGATIAGIGTAIQSDQGGIVVNAGTISGDVRLGSPYYYYGLSSTYIADGGTLSGNLTFGNGYDTVLALNGETGVTGTIEGGGGINNWGRFYRSDATTEIGGTLPTNFQRELVEAIGADTTVTLTGAATDRGLTVAGDGAIVNQADIAGPLVATYDTGLTPDGMHVLASLSNEGALSQGISGVVQAFDNSGTIATDPVTGSAVALTLVGAAQVSNSGTIGSDPNANALMLSMPDQTGITLTNSGTINGYVWLNFSGDNSVTNSGTINGSMALNGNGNNSVVNSGTISGDVTLGNGDDNFTQALSGTLGGMADGGDGTDTLTIDITGGGALDHALFAKFLNFEDFQLTGSGAVTTDGPLPVQTFILQPGTAFELAAGSTLQTLGPVALTGSIGDDHVINHGMIVGNVDLGGGNDRFDYYAGSSVSGAVDGGTGTDRLSFYLDGTSTSPTQMNFSPYAGFEQMTLESGVGSIFGDVSFETIAVNAGRLIGLAGSTITASQGIMVAAGATFGSAGTVNADVSVAGTLSPGASPGTMTINGNVSLASGSTTLFEMTPAVSDALVISGKLTIASGATLDITGNRPLTPGVTYDLITAGNGIDGSFSTISKASTVLGFLRQTQNALQLLGTLQLHPGANPQVAAITDYINSTLINGTATAGIYNRVVDLVRADGFADSAAIATLGPQPYASASQIGIDNGMAIANAVRAMPQGGEGLFALGQGLGAWHDLQGSPDAGLYQVSQNMGGFLGGIGYRAGPLVVSVFGGMTYARQAIGGLGARTRSDGGFVGGSIGLTMGGFDIGGSLVWDGSSADTTRTLYDASRVSGHYSLHTLTLDGHAGYAVALGAGGWRLGPQVGLTYFHVKRGAAQETGGSPFALDVAARNQHATFIDAEVRFDMAPDIRLRPYLAAGWHHRLDGNAVLASAGFIGVPAQVTVAGVPYGKDFARVTAGFDWALTRRLSLFARGSDSFNSGTGVRDFNAGLRLSL